MAGTETKRIIELTEASTVQSGDFIAVDSNARGTKKVSTDTLATSAALTAETNARAGADTAEAQAREAADNTLGGQVADVKSDLSEIADGFSNLEQYLYAENKYINASMAETALAGYNLYKIPVEHLDVVRVAWDTVAKFWNAISSSYVVRYEKSDHTYKAPLNTDAVFDEAGKGIFAIIPSDAINLCICAYGDYAEYVTVTKNVPNPSLKMDAVERINTVTPLTANNSIKSQFYLHNNNLLGIFGEAATTYFIKAKAGDRVVWNESMLGFLSRQGTFRKSDDTVTEILVTQLDYTFTEDVTACLYGKADSTVITFYPKDSIKITYENIEDIPPFETNNPYKNLNGIAFGTSLTYRALTTGGFLQYLEPLAEMTFDNQGLGSSTILPVSGQPEMMPKITGYTGYAGKNICLFEGFCNDWYYNPDKLGTWKDSGQTTVCGCVRYAINYIWTQNPNLTIFLILDHFGQGISASTATNNNGQTQYEWWAEIEKVALSMGVRVIREYEIAEINEKTPRYLLDNIHLNALGAEQSANAIWSAMKQSVPNI